MELPKTINAPDWDNPKTKEFVRAERKYSPLAKTFEEFVEMVIKAIPLFKKLPNNKNPIIIKTGTPRNKEYYGLDPDKTLPFPSKTCELIQTSDTRKEVMRVLHSAIKFKKELKYVLGDISAAELYGELENNLRFLFTPPAWSITSGTSTTEGINVTKQEYIYAGDNVFECRANEISDAKKLVEKLIKCQEDWYNRPGKNNNVISEQMLPTDLITSLIAVKEFSVSRGTLKRAVKNGELISYRRPNAASNSKHFFSRSQIENLYTKRYSNPE